MSQSKPGSPAVFQGKRRPNGRRRSATYLRHSLKTFSCRLCTPRLNHFWVGDLVLECSAVQQVSWWLCGERENRRREKERLGMSKQIWEQKAWQTKNKARSPAYLGWFWWPASSCPAEWSADKRGPSRRCSGGRSWFWSLFSVAWTGTRPGSWSQFETLPCCKADYPGEGRVRRGASEQRCERLVDSSRPANRAEFNREKRRTTMSGGRLIFAH